MVVNNTLRGSVMLSGLSLGDHLNKIEGRSGPNGQGGGNRTAGARTAGGARGFKGTTLESVADTEPTVDMMQEVSSLNESFAAISLDEQPLEDIPDDVSLPSLQPSSAGVMMTNNSTRSLKSTRSRSSGSKATGMLKDYSHNSHNSHSTNNQHHNSTSSLPRANYSASRSQPSSPTSAHHNDHPGTSNRRAGIKPRGMMSRAHTDDSRQGSSRRLGMMRDFSHDGGGHAAAHHHSPVHSGSTMRKQKSMRRTRSLNRERGDHTNNTSFRGGLPKLKVTQSGPVETYKVAKEEEIKWSRGSNSNKSSALQREHSLKFSSHHTVRTANDRRHMSARNFENMHSSFMFTDAGNHSDHSLMGTTYDSFAANTTTTSRGSIAIGGGGGGDGTMESEEFGGGGGGAGGGSNGAIMGRIGEYNDMDLSEMDLGGSGTTATRRRTGSTIEGQSSNDAMSAFFRFFGGGGRSSSGGGVGTEELDKKRRGEMMSSELSSRRTNSEQSRGQPTSQQQRPTKNRTNGDDGDVGDILGSLDGLPGHWTRNAECTPSAPNSPKRTQDKTKEVNYLPSLKPSKAPSTLNNLQEKIEDSLFVQNINFLQDMSKGVTNNISHDVDKTITHKQEQVMDSRFVRNVDFLQDYTQERATNFGHGVNQQIHNKKEQIEHIDDSLFAHNINYLQQSCQTFATNLGNDVNQEIENRKSLFNRNLAVIGSWFNKN